MFEGRAVATEEAFYRRLHRDAAEHPGIAEQDLEITVLETTRHDQGIRGRAGDDLVLDHRVDQQGRRAPAGPTSALRAARARPTSALPAATARCAAGATSPQDGSHDRSARRCPRRRVTSARRRRGPHVRAEGREGDPVVVLVHGFGSSSRYWSRLVAALSPTRRVLAVDLPGFGRSPHPPRPLTVPEHGEALGALLADQGVRGAVVVGHSLGCQVVVDLAVRDPGAARALVLVGPTTDDRARRAVVQAWRLARNAAREPLSLAPVQVGSYLACGPRTQLGALRSMLADHLEEHLPGVAVPTLLLRGEHDPIAPRAWVRRLAALAPRVGTAEVPGAHHVVQWTHPRELARYCTGLATRPSAGPAGGPAPGAPL